MSQALLRRYPLFGMLPSYQLDRWLASAQVQDFVSGETIFQEGLPGEWAYLVLAGRVRILRRSDQGGEVCLGLLSQGELFGDFALVPPHSNTATCRSAGQTRLLALPLQPLRQLLDGLPEIKGNLKNWLRLHTLAAYLRNQTFLGFMSSPSALTFLDRLQTAHFPAQHTIQADGLGDDCWYFIESGQVSLQTSEQRDGAAPRQLGPGECFGERALAGHGRLPVAVAVAETRCQSLPRHLFCGQSRSGMSMSGQSLRPDPPSLAREFVWVGQQEAADCGVAALAMTARFLGLDVSVTSLRQAITVGQSGASLQALQELAVAIGLQAVAVRVGAEQLPQVALPALAHYRSGHYVVLYQIGVNGMVIGDPGTGLLRAARDQFLRAWSGNLLLIKRSTFLEADKALAELLGTECTPEECRRLLDGLDDERLRELATWKIEGLSNDEIAARTQCSVATVERKLRLIRSLWSQK